MYLSVGLTEDFLEENYIVLNIRIQIPVKNTPKTNYSSIKQKKNSLTNIINTFLYVLDVYFLYKIYIIHLNK